MKASLPLWLTSMNLVHRTALARQAHGLMRMPKAADQENHRKMAADVNAVTPRIAKPRHMATPGPEAVRRRK